MDKDINTLVDEVAFDLLPREEALVRMYGLIDKYGTGNREAWAITVADKHQRQYGHKLDFGCCRGVTADDVQREQLRLSPDS